MDFTWSVPLKIFQQSTINKPKLPYAEIFWDYVTPKASKCQVTGSFKNVNCSEHKSQTFVNIFFGMYEIIRLCSFTNFSCKVRLNCCTNTLSA